MALKIRLTICVLFLLLAAWAGVTRLAPDAYAQTPATPTPTPRASQDDGFGNVQLLKGVRDLLPTMHFIRASLGVRCDYCHVTELNKYRLDDKPAKRRAREMIAMTRQINETAFGGRQVVTCNTCHRGSIKPVGVPQIATNFVNTTRVESFEPPPPAMPSITELFTRHETATHASTIGPAKLRVEVHRGKLIDGGTPKARMLPRADVSVVEALVDGERGVTTARLSNGQPARVGSVGSRLWIIRPNGPQWITTGDLETPKRGINPLLVLRVRESDYSSIAVVGTETVDGVDTYVVSGDRTDGSAETLWFSKRDGLLVRRTYYHQTLLGPEPEQYDLSGYKRVGAVKLPTVVNVSYLDDQHLGVLKRLLDIKLDITVTDRDFEPAPSDTRSP